MQRALKLCLAGGVCWLALLFSVQAWADVVWVALSSKEPVYQETANAIRAALPNDEVRVGEWDEFNFKTSPPQILVTVGGEALRQLHRSVDKTRIIALLVPRSTLDELSDASAPGRITGVYYEQPFSRQVSLLRTAFPERLRVGVVLGPATVRYRNQLASSFSRAGLQGVFEVIQDKAELADAVQSVLSSSDVFLALPDAEAINNQTVKFILLASYRRGVPVVGYSASFVKAGAAFAMVSSPAQIGKEAAQMVHESLPGRKLPAPRAPDDFDLLVNTNVLRSLHLSLDVDRLEKRVRSEGVIR